ncbi:unnamed protein product [Meloidogyne enterolobii]|uniref:Uncharacterized protein n=1 Tax=Meloidogyne enterolobii TaxID=390850 RepID=A0ACB0ZFG2_MELEN
MEFVLDKLLKEIEEITNKKIIGGSWQRAIKKYKCGEFERTDDLIGEENILNEFFDQIDLDNFRRTINLLNKDLAKHRQRIATKIVKYLEENPGKKLFVVVSAGHLVGDDSLIKILAEQGFNLKQYSPSENPSEFIQNFPEFTKKEEENNEFILKTRTTNKIPNIVFAAALQGNPPSYYENRNIREEKNRENEENKNLDEDKLIELNNGEDGDLLLTTTKIIPLIKNNMTEENKNFSTFISSNRHSKKSYFWIYFTSILSIILIILILCWYIYNKHSGYLKPPHLPFINDKTNCCQQQSSNISVAKGLPELKNNSQQQQQQQQIWSTTTPKPTISSPQYSQQQQQNIFPLNTSPPKSATSFSEASNATGETSFNICENEGGENIKNVEEEIKNNDSWENKNENSSPLNPTITTTPLVDGQYRSTSSLALSLNQSRMEINDKNQKLPQEPLKSPPFPPPPPSQQQHSTLPTIPESKRLAPPPPTDSVIKHKKLASLDENDEKIVENLDFNSPTNYFNNSKITEELLPSENQQQQIYNNLNKNEYNGSNFNYPPLINNKEIQQSEIYLPEEDNQNSQQQSSSNSFPFTEVINNLNEEVVKNDEK